MQNKMDFNFIDIFRLKLIKILKLLFFEKLFVIINCTTFLYIINK